MPLAFSISPASDVPIFRQIMRQIQRAVALGRISVGDQLPAVRTLAESLVINPNTVARSYQELIRDGVLESRSGKGVYVSQRRQVFADSERIRRLQHATEQLCHEAILLDFNLREVRAMLDQTWSELQSEAGSGESPSKRTPK
jgi:GntR family transcriptional regulator